MKEVWLNQRLMSWAGLVRQHSICGAEPSEVVGGRAKPGQDEWETRRVENKTSGKHPPIGYTTPKLIKFLTGAPDFNIANPSLISSSFTSPEMR